MDREEVTKWLSIMKANLNSFPEVSNAKKIEALAEAIRLLKNEQSEKPTGSTTKNDLGVDREDAVERLNALKQFIGYDKDSEIVKATQKSLDMAISALEQEPKIGHWIMTSDYLTTAYGSVDYVKCSCCGEDSLEEGDYCPNCGSYNGGASNGNE